MVTENERRVATYLVVGIVIILAAGLIFTGLITGPVIEREQAAASFCRREGYTHYQHSSWGFDYCVRLNSETHVVEDRAVCFVENMPGWCYE
jgi:hypothetical protein